MLILTLDAALATGSAGLVEDECVIGQCLEVGGRGSGLAVAAASLLDGRRIDLVAVTVGPGSFTGLRAALALAHGIGLAAGVPVHGVTVGAAMPEPVDGRTLWTAIDSRRGRVFLDIGGVVTSAALDDLPTADRVAVAGDAAVPVAARLAARGDDVQLLPARRPEPLGIALAVLRGQTRPAQPLYVDPPEARPGPAGRPPPR